MPTTRRLDCLQRQVAFPSACNTTLQYTVSHGLESAAVSGLPFAPALSRRAARRDCRLREEPQRRLIKSLISTLAAHTSYCGIGKRVARSRYRPGPDPGGCRDRAAFGHSLAGAHAGTCAPRRSTCASRPGRVPRPAAHRRSRALGDGAVRPPGDRDPQTAASATRAACST